MKRGAVVGIVAGVALVAVAGGIIAWTLPRPESAEDVAETYLRALSDGDFEAVQAVLEEPVGAFDVTALRTAFESASGYITAYDATLTDAAGGSKGVRADVELGGAPGTIFFGLQQEGGVWKVAYDMLGVLDVTTTLGDSVRVGDALHPANTRVSLLPAVYPVTAAPTGILIGETEAVVTNDEPVQVSLDAVLSPGATAPAQEQIDAYATRCAAATDDVPANCGLRVPWAADLATLDRIAFRIEAIPVVALDPGGRSFAATAGAIVATAAGTAPDGSAASFTYRADDWSLRGTVRFSGEEMALLVG